ncbi:putative leucine-rich repeat-containing protein DDB_G0290503 isoform X2 [Cardiocondyla obscurior]|uniref:putative leucine-rich repeat-containing protein DDB_G0290503 isoform X2 n=1 Tax=Cardiocondyla obscurior TaxID=286306 RepID=UPI0039656072
MSRLRRDSKEDCETKDPKLTRMLPISPVRRSSRIKQNKCLPDSESDSNSVNSTAPTSDVFDTKKLRPRKVSISSDMSELDGDMSQTPGKRVTRQSTSSLVGTPTRITRATSKRLNRATSELQSPSLSGRVTRNTRASSVDPEYLSNQQMNQFDSPIKTRKLSLTLSTSSLTKEQELKERVPYVRLDSTIVEADEETTSTRSSDSVSNKAYSSHSKKIKKLLSIDNVEIRNDNNESETRSTSSKNESETLQSSQTTVDETQAECTDNVTVKNTFAEEQHEKSLSLDVATTINEDSIYSFNSSRRNSAEEEKTEKENESLSNIEKSLIDMCKSTEVLENASINLLDISTQQEKSDKTNQILNSTIDVSLEESTQPAVAPLGVISISSSPMNKSFNKKKTIEKELSTNRHSEKSTEIANKHDDTNLSHPVEATSNSQIDIEKMDTSVEFLKSVATNKTVFSQRDSTKLINEDESCIEIMSTEKNLQEMNNELDETEVVKMDDKGKSMNLMQFSQDDSAESSISVVTADDDNEIKAVEQQNSSQDKNKVSSNDSHSKLDESWLKKLQITPSNKNSNRTNVIQDRVSDSSNSTKKIQENLSEHVTELTPKSSKTVLQNDSESNCSNNVTEDDQLSDAETSKKSKTNTFSEKMDAENEMSEEIVKQNLKRKSTNELKTLNTESDVSQVKINDKKNVEITDNISDVEGINLFQDIPIDKYKEKSNLKTDSMQSTVQSVEVENDNESECNFVLVDKRAWLAAETIKESQEANFYECDSDDTVILKSRLDAAEENTKMNSILEESVIDSTDEEERFKKRRSRTKKRFASEIDQDSLTRTENEDNLITANKSSNESKTALNQSNNRSITNLNKSAEIEEQSHKTSKKLDKEEVENDINKLNRSSLTNKNNTPLRKSLEKRISLNKSLNDLVVQNVSANKSQINNSDAEFNNTDTNVEKKLYKKNQSLKTPQKENADDTTKSEKENISFKDSDKNEKNLSLNRSINRDAKQELMHLDNDESDNSSISIAAMNFESITSSMIVHGRSSSGEDEECDIPSYLFAEANIDSLSISSDDSKEYFVAEGTPKFSDEDDERDVSNYIFTEANSDSHSLNSDVNKEYNLAGVSPKFSDEDVSADECRTSEEELSDSNDDGEDLADFIVHDDDTEDEVDIDTEYDTQDDAENDVKDIHNIKDKNKPKSKNVKEKDKTTYKKQHEDKDNKRTYIDKDSTDIKNKNVDSDDGQEKYSIANVKKDTKKNKFVGTETDSYPSTSKMLNSDLSIKKKKKKNNTVLSHASKITSPSIRKKKKSALQRSSQDESKEDLSTRFVEDACQINEKKKKKNKKRNISQENITDETLAEDAVKLKIPKKKKSVKFTESTIARDNSLENLYQINEKKKQNTSMENIDKALPENAVKEKITKKKKRVKFTQITTGDDNISQVAIQTNKKKKKKQNSSIEDSTATTLSQDVIKPNISKKKKSIKLNQLTITDNENVTRKKQKKRKSDMLQENIDDNVEDAMELQYPKKKKRVKITHLTTESDNILQDAVQINKKKKKKRDPSVEDAVAVTLSQDETEPKIPKKKKSIRLNQLTIADNESHENVTSKKQKKRKSDVFKENINESFEDTMELIQPKKKKRTEFIQSSIVEKNTDKDTYQINERKKKKKQKVRKNIEKVLSEELIELNIPKKKKRTKVEQLAVTGDDTCENENNYESTCQVQEKPKKKKKKITMEGDKNEENTSEKIIRKSKRDLAQQKNKTVKVLKLKSALNKSKAKIKLAKQETSEGIKKMKKDKSTVPVQIPVSKMQPEENILLPKLSPRTTSSASNSEKTKNLDKKAAKVSIPKEAKTEKKSKKKYNQSDDDIENVVYMNVPTKEFKKKSKEITKVSPSTSGLKQLPQDVIDNLSDVPLRAKKRQVLQNKKQLKPSVKIKKTKAIAKDNDNSLKLNTSDCATQFNLINIKDIKKQKMKGAATTASFRERMLNRNDREPISTYLMFRDKKKVG